MRRLLILGTGGHSGVVVDAAQESGYEIVGLISCTDYAIEGWTVHGYKVLSGFKDLWELYQALNVDCIHIAIGNEAYREQALAKLNKISESKMIFQTIIHPRGYVSHMATLGQGSFVGINAVIEANATVGDFCILRAGYIVKHDEKIKSFVTL